MPTNVSAGVRGDEPGGSVAINSGAMPFSRTCLKAARYSALSKGGGKLVARDDGEALRLCTVEGGVESLIWIVWIHAVGTPCLRGGIAAVADRRIVRIR
jgi:hypothetical protein